MRVDIRPALANALNNFKAFGGLKAIGLTWDLPSGDPTYKAAQVWINTINDEASATLYGTFNGNALTLTIMDTTTRYFWIRAVNIYDRADGPFTGPASATASTVTSQDVVMDLASSQVVGNLDKSRVTGLGALAALNKAGITDITGLGALATKDVITADVIGAGTLAAGVVYAGSVYANQIRANNLSSMTATIGTLRTASLGGRVEISDNIIKVFDTGNNVRCKFGDTSL